MPPSMTDPAVTQARQVVNRGQGALPIGRDNGRVIRVFTIGINDHKGSIGDELSRHRRNQNGSVGDAAVQQGDIGALVLGESIFGHHTAGVNDEVGIEIGDCPVYPA